jgi:glycosyltransferase involved in cell wall biosynthesis
VRVDLVFALEHRFLRTPDGVVRTRTGFASPFWTRYLSVFGRIRVVARVEDVSADHEGLAPAEAEGVSFVGVPYYVGPAQYLQKRRLIQGTLRGIDVRGAAVLLRVPGVLSFGLRRALPVGYPFAVEVVGDPHDGFGAAGFKHPLRPFFQWWFARELRRHCKDATCSLYVTKSALQERYPPGGGSGRVFGVADVEMPDEAYVESSGGPGGDGVPRRERIAAPGGPLRLICVGTLDQLYKRQDVLIRSVQSCVSAGLDLTVTLIGGGQKMAELVALTREIGLSGRVDFKGTISSGAAVREQLDEHDLFVLPSMTEGLPRAMLEAMARGLPCIGTAVGGIPELLPDYALVPPNDERALAERIGQFAQDAGLRERAARENFATARSYHERVLQPRRVAFFQQIVRATEAYQAKSIASGPIPLAKT